MSQEGKGATGRGGSHRQGREPREGESPTHQAIMHPFCWRDGFILKIFFICLNFCL